jgi:SAM-dependent methyltransferase
MTAATDALYEALARWQWRGSKAARRRGEPVDLRKRLCAGDGAATPADGGAGFDAWLRTLAGAGPDQRVLDLGCGFGATLLRWLEAPGGEGVGVTTSAFQVARATDAAIARGLAARARFVRQHYGTPVAGPFDVVLAIESIGHAEDLAAVLAAVRKALAPRGRFVWVEDLLDDDGARDEDVDELARRWASPPLRTVAEARERLAHAGLILADERDLTASVPVRDDASLARAGSRLRWLRHLAPLPFLRRVGDAFLGGVALERLYARGRASYRVFVCDAATEHPQ